MHGKRNGNKGAKGEGRVRGRERGNGDESVELMREMRGTRRKKTKSHTRETILKKQIETRKREGNEDFFFFLGN